MRYDFKCLECGVDEKGKPLKTATVSVPIKEYVYETCAPHCEQHGRMNQMFTNLGLAETHRNKGLFPYIDTNMGNEPIRVESQQHRRQLMKERGLHDRQVSDGARDRVKTQRRKSFSFGR